MKEFPKPKSFPERFKYAFQGVLTMIKTQSNARVHLLATVATVTAGIYYHIALVEWLGIVLAITTVWAAEAFNTALEFLADATHPEHHPLIGRAKDIAAGAVLVSAFGAVTIGILVFKPYIMQ